MAKVVYRAKGKSIVLSCAETLLLLMAELGAEVLDTFTPRKYPETRLTRRLFGLDGISNTSIRSTRHRLLQRGFVARTDGGSRRMTRKGQEFVEKLQGVIGARQSVRWDGRWRIVAFDIPETRKRHRDALRYALAHAGYHRLQDSVWVARHPLPRDVFLLIEACGISEYVYFFLASAVGREEDLQRLFPAEG